MATTTALASSNTGSNFATLSNVANAYTNSSSTTYAQLNTPTKTTGVYTIYFTGFDFSEIPSTAIINSVTIKVKARVNSTSYISAATVQAYKGTTATGSSTNIRTTSTSTYTLNSGTWSRADLNNLRIFFSVTRSNNKNNAAYAYVYGMDVTVNWERDPSAAKPLYLKQNGVWTPVKTVYMKVNGSWVEQYEPENILSTTVNYVKG